MFRNRRESNQFQLRLDTQNFAEAKGKETIEIAAEKSGFGNKETYLSFFKDL